MALNKYKTDQLLHEQLDKSNSSSINVTVLTVKWSVLLSCIAEDLCCSVTLLLLRHRYYHLFTSSDFIREQSFIVVFSNQ